MTPAKHSHDFSKTILKQKEVPGYVSNNYRCCRIFAPSSTVTSDGVEVMIPISLVFHKSLVEKKEEGAWKESMLPQGVPVLMSGYGKSVRNSVYSCV